MNDTAPSQVYFNGRYLPISEASISPLDRGFLFGDGVYEVIPVFHRKMLGSAQHFRRLKQSMEAILIAPPLDGAGWAEVCSNLVALNNLEDCSIYIQVTRGAVGRRDHVFPIEPVPPTVFAMAAPLPVGAGSARELAKGCVAVTLNDIRWRRCDIKSTALLGNILLRMEGVVRGATEAILLRDGLLTEGTSSNVFVVRGGMVCTPPSDNHILGGVTRGLVIELLARGGVDIRENNVTRRQLGEADEIWLTSSLRGVVPVVQLDGHPVGCGIPGPVWRNTADHYDALIEEKRSAGADLF